MFSKSLWKCKIGLLLFYLRYTVFFKLKNSRKTLIIFFWISGKYLFFFIFDPSDMLVNRIQKLSGCVFFWLTLALSKCAILTIYVTERSHRWLRDVRLRGGFELRCCLALSYLNVLKRFPNENKDRNFRCLLNQFLFRNWFNNGKL